ncbi:MAG TPA: MBL fold metallo-hydrolase [Nocardioides sp.]|uniref:MBL fold metallo-hydrolase n=1 Tax=Nocardioides sp. TaxID=35761 RepID=UPI002E33D38A|nr:MBL fold metallo-hydrolase [Nocardioides sp.]HEX5086274.1 MBL fold metallo-hydrolase [Nocardioides sp.]
MTTHPRRGGLHMSSLVPLDGPTVLIDLAGVRLLVDPTFDAAQDYPIGSRTLRKTSDATWGPDQVGAVDAVLLSHDQHPDNLDHGGRAFLAGVPLTLTTEVAAERLGGTARALPPWTTHQVGAVTVTGVPAQHGPDGTEHLTGPVTGFVLTADRGPSIYVSGDNASLDVVTEVARRFPGLDVAVLFAGAARTPLVDGYLTLTSEEAARAAELLGRPRVLGMHTDGWAHFTQDGGTFRDAFAAAGLADLLLPVDPGARVEL